MKVQTKMLKTVIHRLAHPGMNGLSGLTAAKNVAQASVHEDEYVLAVKLDLLVAKDQQNKRNSVIRTFVQSMVTGLFGDNAVCRVVEEHGIGSAFASVADQDLIVKATRSK